MKSQIFKKINSLLGQLEGVLFWLKNSFTYTYITKTNSLSFFRSYKKNASELVNFVDHVVDDAFCPASPRTFKRESWDKA